MRVVETDCLVIGAGLAGSAYAIHAARAGARVEILSLADPLQANSDWAQGGIIYDTSPSTDLLARDIFEASDHAANRAAIAQLVREGPDAVRALLLDELAVPFDRDAAGELHLTAEGGHSARRIIHAKDATGHAILDPVSQLVGRTPGITRRTGFSGIDLLTLSHNAVDPKDRYEPLTCFGCYALDSRAGDVVAFVAKKTTLATGGLGGIFQHTTNQPGSVGHGVAMAYRVGARLIDLEFVQFHPTVFFKKGAPPFLITEALRGEGAIIVDRTGRHVMEGQHPRGSLAPRDVVSRVITHHLAESGDPCVFLDLSALSADEIHHHFPSIQRRCAEHGVDITREPIPVVPAAHFSCGGVHADLTGRTNVRHLNAIGETACTGLHGANRLASTSLLECLVSAKAAADRDARDLAEGDGFPVAAPRPWQGPDRTPDPVLIRQDLQTIQQTMWNYAGVIRSPRRLARAHRILLELREDIQAFYRDCRLTPELIELRNAVQTALLVVHAAALNRVSRGCHYVIDEQ